MARLHTLTVPDWHDFVACHVTCFTPLVAMESLQKIMVRQIRSHDKGAFPAALCFEELPGAKCTCTALNSS